MNDQSEVAQMNGTCPFACSALYAIRSSLGWYCGCPGSPRWQHDFANVVTTFVGRSGAEGYLDCLRSLQEDAGGCVVRVPNKYST